MEPVRTCVGCRTRAPRSALLRVVAIDDRLVPDDRATMPGRGAWVHETPECVTTALRRRAFVRALRVSRPLDAQTIEKRLNGYGNKVNGSK
ncbi:YlxR family protein [Microbacterium xanthum]|uniref:YlxR family protein n=1 Tax=Microbacterium xanthum TaxID=3079794 RepID=UPI002AD2FC8D|nr:MULTISPECIES: YlxR family protein [unclassified Microbacterium]MDZ8171266.1 YlxR family protein [Microbacterium sp. KSW-48]MDZ8201760.1 YlxR family protein [Microbacterium sp. SSW1-59]